MVTTTPLTNVIGRVDYISNPERQEHLEAVYSGVTMRFWKELSAHCQKAAKEAGHKKTREAREFMMPIANELAWKYNPYELCEKISAEVKQITGTENITALHWNKTRSNYHCHIVVAENEKCDEIKEGAVFTRNTYFDAEGKRSTKGKCTDIDGQLLKGCSFYPKGSCLQTRKGFKAKKSILATKSFLQDFKQQMANFQNNLLREKRFEVCDSSVYLGYQHIGKDKTEEIEDDIRAKNATKKEFNKITKELVELSKKIPQNEKKRLIEGLKLNRQVAGESFKQNKFDSTIAEIISGMKQLQDQFDDKLTDYAKLSIKKWAENIDYDEEKNMPRRFSELSIGRKLAEEISYFGDEFFEREMIESRIYALVCGRNAFDNNLITDRKRLESTLYITPKFVYELCDENEIEYNLTEQQQENLGIYNDVDYGDGDELFKMLEDVVYQNKWQQPTQQQNKQRERDYEWEI